MMKSYQLGKIVGLALGCLGGMACGDSEPDPGVTPPPTVMNSEGRVSISGRALVGETLTANIVDPNGTGSPTFQWSAGGADILEATMSTYVLTEAEVGKTIAVGARYTDGAGFLEVLTSTPTEAVVAELNVDGAIAIMGVPTVGETLAAVITDMNGTTTSAPAYVWLAGGAEIPGATSDTYVLVMSDVGARVSVRATYTDDAGFVEMVSSSAIGPVSETAVNVPGTLSIMGSTVVGQPLTAAVLDANGLPAALDYQWMADGVVIPNATTETFVPTAAQRGAILSVSTSYMDQDGFAEGPLTATAGDIVYSFIVTGEISLLAAVATATTGDIIGLAEATGGDDYEAMAEVNFAADEMLIRRTAGSNAVVTGPTCIVVSGNGTVIDGLLFDRLDWLVDTLCDANGDGSVYLSGTNDIIRNCEFRGEAFPRTVPSSDPYHFLALKGVDNVVERNLFQDKDMDNEGSAITMFANTVEMSNQGHTIQYNLFRNMPGRSGNASDRESTAHAIQVGRTTGSDAQGNGLFTIQYNRFDSIESERRIMRVQSGGNMIRGNTIVNSAGLIALEDGYANTVTRNVILSGGEDNDDGGISFAPLGHTVTDNYINNIRTTSSQRAALFINADPLSGSGNGAIISAPGLDFTVTVARNTVVNARQAIAFEDRDCGLLDHVLDFDDNLIVNQTSGMSINMNTNGSGRTAITDGDFVAEPCAISNASDFDNNHFYSETLSQSGAFNFNGAAGDNLVGPQDGATFMLDANGLLSATGASVGVGVDTSTLHVVLESEVGPGSTWTAP